MLEFAYHSTKENPELSPLSHPEVLLLLQKKKKGWKVPGLSGVRKVLH